MNHIKSKLTAWIGLLAICLLPVGAHAKEHRIPVRKQPPSGIIGVVEDGTGLPEFGVWTVTVDTAPGKPVATVETDSDGFFRLDLKPGTYVLTPRYFPQIITGPAVPLFVIEGPATRVQVVRDRFTFVELPAGLYWGPVYVDPIVGFPIFFTAAAAPTK